MIASFDGPNAKAGRARQYLNDLDDSCRALRDLNLYEITNESDSQTGEYVYRFAKVPLIPDDLSLLMGDALYNSRACLDHLLWQLVLANNQTPSPRNEFPIFIDPAKYGAEKRNKIRGVSNAVEAVIDGLQPCNGGYEGLWFLQVLGNVDKHRHLLTYRRATFTIDLMTYESSFPRMRVVVAPIEEGAEFLRTKEKVDMQVKPRIEVLFTNAPPVVRPDRLPVPNIFGLIHIAIDDAFLKLRPHLP